jgi:salicylate hydroxylase
LIGFQALALRGKNRSILVLEQSLLNREIGATISLQPNASKFVEREWGLGPKLRKRGSMIDKAFRICSVDGKEHKRVDLTSKVQYGGDRMVYHRQDLHEVLKLAVTDVTGDGPPAEILVGSRVVSCDCEAGSVTLESGKILGGFDLIIGADGIRSKLRKYVVGKEADSVPTGQSAYRMMITASDIENDEEIRKFLDPREAVTTMVIGHTNRLIMGPARNGEVYSIVAMVPDGMFIPFNPLTLH